MAKAGLSGVENFLASVSASVVSMPDTTTSKPLAKKPSATCVGSAVTPGMLNQKPIHDTLKRSCPGLRLSTCVQAWRAPR